MLGICFQGFQPGKQCGRSPTRRILISSSCIMQKVEGGRRLATMKIQSRQMGSRKSGLHRVRLIFGRRYPGTLRKCFSAWSPENVMHRCWNGSCNWDSTSSRRNETKWDMKTMEYVGMLSHQRCGYSCQASWYPHPSTSCSTTRSQRGKITCLVTSKYI